MSTGQGDPGGMGAGQGPGPGGRQPTEDELRAAYEAEIAKVTVDQVLLEHVVTLINLGMRRTGLVPGTESERDQTQVRLAIESIRAQLPLLEQAAPNHIAPIREALSQLQLAFVRIGGSPTEAPAEPSAQGGPGAEPATGVESAQGAEGATGSEGASSAGGDSGAGPAGPAPGTAPPGDQTPPPSPKPGEPGPAQRSGRLWVPGQ